MAVFSFNRSTLKGIPCHRDCPRRCMGCAVTCLDWAEYVKAREEKYKRRADMKRVNDVINDGYRRLAKNPPKR